MPPRDATAAVAEPTVEEQEAQVVEMFAKAKLLEAEAATLKSLAKPLAERLYRAHGLSQIVGPEGVVAVVETKVRETLDTKKVRRLLTPEQIADCTTVGEPGISFRYSSREVRR